MPRCMRGPRYRSRAGDDGRARAAADNCPALHWLGRCYSAAAAPTARRSGAAAGGGRLENSFLRDAVDACLRVDGVKYGPITAAFDQRTGANAWLTVTLKEGKNREIRKVMEHIGLGVNRLIRTAYGPFQIGNLPQGDVEEVRPKALRDMVGGLLK